MTAFQRKDREDEEEEEHDGNRRSEKPSTLGTGLPMTSHLGASV